MKKKERKKKKIKKKSEKPKSMPSVVFRRDHLRFGIICGPIWGSFPVWGSFAVGDHLRRCTGHVIDTKVEYCFRCNSCIQLLNALEAGKAPARRRIHNWSCGQNSLTSEDQRLWTEGKMIIAFGFFLFHRWKSTDRAGAIHS